MSNATPAASSAASAAGTGTGQIVKGGNGLQAVLGKFEASTGGNGLRPEFDRFEGNASLQLLVSRSAQVVDEIRIADGRSSQIAQQPAGERGDISAAQLYAGTPDHSDSRFVALVPQPDGSFLAVLCSGTYSFKKLTLLPDQDPDEAEDEYKEQMNRGARRSVFAHIKESQLRQQGKTVISREQLNRLEDEIDPNLSSEAQQAAIVAAVDAPKAKGTYVKLKRREGDDAEIDESNAALSQSKAKRDPAYGAAMARMMATSRLVQRDGVVVIDHGVRVQQEDDEDDSYRASFARSELRKRRGGGGGGVMGVIASQRSGAHGTARVDYEQDDRADESAWDTMEMGGGDEGGVDYDAQGEFEDDTGVAAGGLDGDAGAFDDGGDVDGAGADDDDEEDGVMVMADDRFGDGDEGRAAAAAGAGEALLEAGRGAEELGLEEEEGEELADGEKAYKKALQRDSDLRAAQRLAAEGDAARLRRRAEERRKAEAAGSKRARSTLAATAAAEGTAAAAPAKRGRVSGMAAYEAQVLSSLHKQLRLNNGRLTEALMKKFRTRMRSKHGARNDASVKRLVDSVVRRETTVQGDVVWAVLPAKWDEVVKGAHA